MTLNQPNGNQPKSRNIERPEWEPPSWEPNNVASSLERLRVYVEQHAQAAINWYYARKRPKDLLSKWLRGLAIASTAVGGLMPVLAATGIFSKGLDPSHAQLRELHAHQFGYLCLGLAALFLTFDKYFGVSSGWIRYISTAMSLETTLEQFRLDWARITAPLHGAVPEGKTLETLIQRITDFSVTVRALVEKETQAWVTEFQSNLAQLEKETKDAVNAAKAQVETMQKEAQERQRSTSPGAIELTVENVLETDRGYSVALDGKAQKADVTSKTCALREIAPGLHDLTITATLSGAAAHASQIVTVKAETAEKVSLTLSKTKAATANP